MSKRDLNKILIVNDYLIMCKFGNLDKRSLVTQKYLTTKIEKVLTEKEKINLISVKTFFSLILNFLIFR
jgi:hypothetical protein